MPKVVTQQGFCIRNFKQVFSRINPELPLGGGLNLLLLSLFQDVELEAYGRYITSQGNPASRQCAWICPSESRYLAYGPLFSLFYWSVPGDRGYLRDLLWLFPSQRHGNADCTSQWRIIIHSYPWNDWLTTKRTDSSGSPGHKTTERGKRNKAQLSGEPMKRTHMLTRTSRFVCRSGLLLLTLYSI